MSTLHNKSILTGIKALFINHSLASQPSRLPACANFVHFVINTFKQTSNAKHMINKEISSAICWFQKIIQDNNVFQMKADQRVF